MSGFQTTHWTLVREAAADSSAGRDALSKLCALSYAPVIAFLRGTGHDEDAARELAHGFFARLLVEPGLRGAEPARGRFRSYLLGALKHYLADMRDRLQAAKRGAQREHISLDAGSDTSPGHECAAPEPQTPDAFFDRQWGLAVLDLALTALAAEHELQGKTEQFQVLKPWLTGEASGLSQSEAALRIGMKEGAVKVAIHRLRKRFRELVKAEIAQTVSTEEEAREELRYFIEVVS